VRSPSGRQWRLDHSQFEAARKDFDSEGSTRRWSLRGMLTALVSYASGLHCRLYSPKAFTVLRPGRSSALSAKGH